MIFDDETSQAIAALAGYRPEYRVRAVYGFHAGQRAVQTHLTVEIEQDTNGQFGVLYQLTETDAKGTRVLGKLRARHLSTATGIVAALRRVEDALVKASRRDGCRHRITRPALHAVLMELDPPTARQVAALLDAGGDY